MRIPVPSLLLSVMTVGSLSWAQPDAPSSRGHAGLPAIADLVETAKNSVVNIEIEVERDKLPKGSPARQNMQADDVVKGAGSGFIIDSKGLVLTNNHVVEHATAIRVRLDDGRLWAAEVLGRDPLTDVALLKLKGKVERLPVANLGNSDALRPGDWVVAIGNPFGLASSVSLGIVSARARQMGLGPYDDFIQTDAAINPGNSGGPLFNLKGQVVGMNTAIISGGGGGLGFAVPINVAKSLIPMLEADGAVTRGWLGLSAQDVDADLAKALKLPVREGVLIIGMNDKSPAKGAGLQVEDVITEMDGEGINSRGVMTKMIANKRPGTQLTLMGYRGTQQRQWKLVVGTRPDIEGVAVAKRTPNGKESAPAPKLGLVVEDREYRNGRVIHVVDVAAGSAAEKAGLEAGVIITEVDRKPMSSSADFIKYVKAAPAGSTLLLRVSGTDDYRRLFVALIIP